MVYNKLYFFDFRFFMQKLKLVQLYESVSNFKHLLLVVIITVLTYYLSKEFRRSIAEKLIIEDYF